MDLRAPAKKDKFDAFKGNSLVKSSSSKSRNNFSRLNLHTSSKNLMEKYTFDDLWRGSVSNLMSSENITEDLIKESIKELESAMQESKRMLTERDDEITRLREFIENNKLEKERHDNDDKTEELEKLQKSIVELECEISELKIKHARELDAIQKQNSFSLPSNSRNDIPECTCYCGRVCKALHDLCETKKCLETTKAKYDNLKKRVREFRKQAEDHRNASQLDYEEEKATSCAIQ
ncbi:uncharacterized protein LOC130647874 [Hydractinia symbiolongicarpus]|uniref:uncharacterized protein LOC130647874 n=1 Tax=Hydractinia symbiolongicarpus TaxID=13093 RepID=UPI0025510912|nr:uncharacterized protein LOC130647874 [Hydractinia symbiolongicarpus]